MPKTIVYSIRKVYSIQMNAKQKTKVDSIKMNTRVKTMES